jgi:DNA-binding MarR family transcriptional regulator
VTQRQGRTSPLGAPGPVVDDAVGDVESALHSLTQSLKQVRLHEYVLDKARVDVDRAGVALLYVLYVENANLRMTDLAEQLQIEAPAVTRKAQQLEQAGLVSRAPDPNDGRASRVQLTALGRRTINRILQIRREWVTTLLAGWTEENQVEFARLIRLFTNNLNQHLKEFDG